MTYIIGTCNIKSTNQGKLRTEKPEIEYLNIAILRVKELKWTELGHFQSENYKVNYSKNDKHRRNWVAIAQSWAIVQSMME